MAIVFDDDLPGFGLRIRAGGKRVWIFQYKIGSQSRRVTLGGVTALTAARARETAGDLHAAVRLGRDPAGEKSEGRMTRGRDHGRRRAVLSDLSEQPLRPQSYVEVERHLMRYCKPLHGQQLAKIDRRTVAARISDVASNSGAVTANRMRASLSAFFAWAMREGLLDNNPVVGTNIQPEQSRARVLDDDELKIIWNALGPDDYSTIIRLLVLTGQRANEIGSLCWSEIAGDRIVLPPQRTKNGREHSIPVTPAVRTILDGREHSDAFVFGRQHAKPFSGWGVSKAGLDQRIRAAGHQLAHWRVHDLRRTGQREWPETWRTAPHIVEAFLNHVGGHKAGVAGIYNRANYEPQKRAALERWAAHVEALVSGKRAATVVKLHG